MLYALHNRLAFDSVLIDGPFRLAVHFARRERQRVRFAEEYVKRWFELEAGFEDGAAAEDVEAQAGAGERDRQAADVAEVADAAGADEGEEDVCEDC